MAALLMRTFVWGNVSVLDFNYRPWNDLPSSSPCVLFMVSRQALMLSSLVTSSATGWKLALRSCSWEMAFSAEDKSLDATKMQQLWDRLAIAWAIQKPMPLLAPVIRMTLNMRNGSVYQRTDSCEHNRGTQPLNIYKS